MGDANAPVQTPGPKHHLATAFTTTAGTGQPPPIAASDPGSVLELRCPTAMPVAGHLLEPVIREHIKELKVVGIKVTHILCPKVKLSVPFKRINALSTAKFVITVLPFGCR